MSNFLRDMAQTILMRNLDPHEIRHVMQTFSGDTEAADHLSLALRNDRRGCVAVLLWQAKIPVKAFRVFLSNVWTHDHRYLIRAAGTRRRLIAMFRYAAFPLPDHLPDQLTVWRGTSRLTRQEARQGHSWTIDRDVACWFAMRFARQNGFPLLFRAVVKKTEIVLFSNERNENEAVLLRPPLGVAVDGYSGEWSLGHDRYGSHIALEGLRRN